MRRNLRSVLALAVIAGWVPALCEPAFAQVSAPPRHDTRSAAGVSYRDGSFSWSEQDVSVGGDDGLSLSRVYLSSTSDGFFAPGWTHNLFSFVRTEAVPFYPDVMLPPVQFRPWVYHFIIGGSTYSFIGGGAWPNKGTPVGSYVSVEDNGASLIYTGTNSIGYYTLTLGDGSVIVFTGGINSRISNWTKPDGTRLDYSYGTNPMVVSNRGYAIILEGHAKACAINLARTYVAPGAACPSGVPTVTYGYTTGTFNTSVQLLTSATKPDGRTTTYGYVGADHLGCVKEPGQSVCKLSNQYAVCPEDPSDPTTHFPWRYRDPVTFQQTATGETYTYTYGNLMPSNNLVVCNVPPTDPATSNNAWQFDPAVVTVTTNTGAQTRVETSVGGLPTLIRDPLGRDSTAEYTGNGVFALSEETQPLWDQQPEGNKTEYAYDSRGNLLSKTMKAKPGSGLSDLTVSAAYPLSCTMAKTCNKPTSSTDARGSVSDFTYDSSSGEVLSEMGPAPASGAARPLKLYTYVQKYAYVLNSSGSLVATSYPIWMPSTLTECQTVAGSSSAACDSSAQQRVTTYEYGANGTADNLLVHGVAVTADGTTLRTCYAYDARGRKIDETAPRASLAVCP